MRTFSDADFNPVDSTATMFLIILPPDAGGNRYRSWMSNTVSLSATQTILTLLVCYVIGLLTATAAFGQKPHMETWKVKTGRSTYVGFPVIHNDVQTVLLRRNGRLTSLSADQIDTATRIADGFLPKTGAQLRVELQREFGSKYDVSLTKHFVVVHPPGAYSRWGLPFEQFYVRYRSWFASRGMQLETPDFPMVAIVLRDRSEYEKFVRRYTDFAYSTAGYYSSESNRMITYDHTDATSDGSTSRSSLETLPTVIHEATHQIGKNTGVHDRLHVQPLWFLEGLATMFEAPGVANPSRFRDADSRINRYQLSVLQRELEAGNLTGKVESLIRSDSLFTHDSELAYAMSWGMNFYLAQKFPADYICYIKALRDDAATSSDNPASRLQYFQEAFDSPERIEGGVATLVKTLSQK